MAMTAQEAIALFDASEPARVADILGDWRGEEVPTGHPMDGLLAASFWWGKRFESPDDAHPLIHDLPLWGRQALNPALIPFHLAAQLPLRAQLGPVLMPILAPLLRTRKPKARLRDLAFRGRVHGAMCYDAKPIHDVFVWLGPDTLLGWMEARGIERPYFFRLHREVSPRNQLRGGVGAR
ncbi:MAG: GXWXG domain-containing protein [Pseudomonadota bacterium]